MPPVSASTSGRCKKIEKNPQYVRVHDPLSSNSGELVRDWCVAGRGIMLRSLWDVAPQLTSGQLVRVLPRWFTPDADIHWLAPYRSDAPRRIRLLIDFLLAEYASEPWKKPAAKTAANQANPLSPLVSQRAPQGLRPQP